MTLFLIILAVVAVLLIGGLVAMLMMTAPIAKDVYHKQLVRTEPDKWGRVCSAPDNEEQVAMWNAGIEWANANKDFMKEVSITNDGLCLCGEYYDFGSDKCVIVSPGRCECLMYSYYFASPYKEAGLNVLVIDSRAHGRSQGTHSTIGVKESGDIKAWMKYIESEFGIKEIWIHGICIGSASALFIASGSDCPASLRGIVTEGCFTTFKETFKQHMIVDKRPLFPVLDLVMYNIKKHTGVDVIKQSPIKVIDKVNCRMLFLFGEKDVFSLPPKSQLLFDKCSSKDKKLVWFDKGGHSHLRINNTEKYDNEIIKFVTNEQ